MSKFAFSLLAGACLALAASASPTSMAAERVALVIGNSSYRVGDLPNPSNDAQDMAELLRQAGFEVDLRLNTTQAQLVDALDSFSNTIRSRPIKFGIFYYAGHGAQQSWRNYLIPVDADVQSADDVTQMAVDLSDLTYHMSRTRDRNFLVILDACRDDPFGAAYQPSAKGLTQYDAPAGSLLAYATGPGRVASDGEGRNGLYTSHLLREMAVKGSRIEDVFKRARLGVRLASRGRQIPWESTSLEEDLFIFPDQRRARLSAAEQEELLDREISDWRVAKALNTVDALASFIQKYPSGHTSELALARFNNLLRAQAPRPRLARLHVPEEVTPDTFASAPPPARPEPSFQVALASIPESRHVLPAPAPEPASEPAPALLPALPPAAPAVQEAAPPSAPTPTADVLPPPPAALSQPAPEATPAPAPEPPAAAPATPASSSPVVVAAVPTPAPLAAPVIVALAPPPAPRVIPAPPPPPPPPPAVAPQPAPSATPLPRPAPAAPAPAPAAAATVTAAAPSPAPVPSLDVQAPVEFLSIPASPHYQGANEHIRHYQVGNVFKFRLVDRFSNNAVPQELRVTAVDTDKDEIQYNDGEYSSDGMGNILKNLRGTMSTPRQFYPAELYVGKKWTTMFRQYRPHGVTYTFQYTLKVVGKEIVTVPAGRFEAYKIEARGFNMQAGARLERNIWVTPGVNADIAHETTVRLSNGRIDQYDRQELVAISAR